MNKYTDYLHIFFNDLINIDKLTVHVLINKFYVYKILANVHQFTDKHLYDMSDMFIYAFNQSTKENKLILMSLLKEINNVITSDYTFTKIMILRFEYILTVITKVEFLNIININKSVSLFLNVIDYYNNGIYKLTTIKTILDKLSVRYNNTNNIKYIQIWVNMWLYFVENTNNSDDAKLLINVYSIIYTTYKELI